MRIRDDGTTMTTRDERRMLWALMMVECGRAMSRPIDDHDELPLVCWIADAALVVGWDEAAVTELLERTGVY